jgi:nitroreductase
MNVFEAIKSRRSIRSFADQTIEEEKLRKVLEAGRLAPSAANMQEWKFVVVRDKETKEKLATAANNQRFIAKADVVIVGCATEVDKIMTCGQYTYPIDLAIAMDHMSLQAVEEGLGTCWIGAFDEAEVKKVLGIPPEIRVVELMPLGYPLFVPEPRPRKGIDEIVAYDRWS